MTPENALTRAAKVYSVDGYAVTVRPQGDQLPSFARGHRIDLMAIKGDEKVIVQVKETREDLEKDEGIIQLVEAVDKAGWRLDLMVLSPEDPFTKPNGALEFSRDQIEKSLERAEHLSATGEHAASCIYAWSALEATMRRFARGAGLELKSVSPLFLTRALYSQGLLSREEFDRLNETIKYRNAVVHGMAIQGLTAKVTHDVISVARRLLSEEKTVSRA